MPRGLLRAARAPVPKPEARRRSSPASMPRRSSPMHARCRNGRSTPHALAMPLRASARCSPGRACRVPPWPTPGCFATPWPTRSSMLRWMGCSACAGKVETRHPRARRWCGRSRTGSRGAKTNDTRVPVKTDCHRCIRRPNRLRWQRAGVPPPRATPRPCRRRMRTARCGAACAGDVVLRPVSPVPRLQPRHAGSRTRRN